MAVCPLAVEHTVKLSVNLLDANAFRKLEGELEAGKSRLIVEAETDGSRTALVDLRGSARLSGIEVIDSVHDLKPDVVEIENIAVSPCSQVECHGVHLLVEVLLGHFGSDDDLPLDLLPYRGDIDVVE